MQIHKVDMVEVGPRDGLQNEKEFVPTEIKVELINRLTQAGFSNIEAASFVSPKWVPQMADGTEVMSTITRKSGVIYSVLTPNMKGFEAALAAKSDEVVIFGAASEAFSQKNINCSIAESIDRFEPVAHAALENGVRLRASISCSFGCPYEGDVPTQQVVEVVKRMQALGVQTFDIADTIGVATAGQVYEVMSAVTEFIDPKQVAGHFHDTYGQALANILSSMRAGIHIFHSSVSGLGGCPYAKGATGNVATEDVLFMLHGMGIETGVDLDKVIDAGDFISTYLKRANASRVGKAILNKRARA